MEIPAPPCVTPEAVIFRTFLRLARKQKPPISSRNQEFTTNCFSSKWCHQKSNYSFKWLNIFDL